MVIVVTGGGVLVVVGRIVVTVVASSTPVVRWLSWLWSHCQRRWWGGGEAGRRGHGCIDNAGGVVVGSMWCGGGRESEGRGT